MKILQVIHGYPMRFNAGSEVYTQALSQALADRHEVHVFTRLEDSFTPDFSLSHERDPDDPRVQLHLVNHPRSRDRYQHEGLDRAFEQVLEEVNPDIVHIGHLNHLSSSLIQKASAHDLPIVFTLHDYWLMCPRGQFIQMHPEDPQELWPLCTGQEDRRCAERCYARYFTGAAEEREADVMHWSGWVQRRMAHIRKMAALVDLFIAPSRYLLDRFRLEFGLPGDKLVYLDYGFPLERLAGHKRVLEQSFTFGYIGTHIPAKGIHHLLEAFGRLRGSPRLRIWGRPRGEDTTALKAIAARLPNGAAERVEWLPEYQNPRIVEEVFNHVDAIVVPSIWVENSPLVIHEALQARVPVVTADAGGMAEYVHHQVNGLLFRHRDPIDLAEQMQRLVDDPALALQLGARGYVQEESGDIPDMHDHVRAVERIYHRVRLRRASPPTPRPGPWRITFDTNPDDCNLRCIMCEEHSPHSTSQLERRAHGAKRRRMDIALIRRTLEASRGTPLREIIPSTMGEPLLYAQFDEILELCQEYGLKLNLTTNGTFPRRGATEWAHRIVPLASDVKISWNGATRKTAEEIMLGVRWERVLQNVRDFVAVRDAYTRRGDHACRVTFQLTFLETNVLELAEIVRLAASLGVERVKGHHLWAHFDPIKPLSMRRSPEAITRWNAAVRDAFRAAEICLLPSGKKVLLENIFELDEGTSEDIVQGAVCPFLGREAWISAEGRFSPCCAPDALRRPLGDFGTLEEHSLDRIWTSPGYQRLRETYQTNPLCRGCNMRRIEEV